jgi:hypothetical protein
MFECFFTKRPGTKLTLDQIVFPTLLRQSIVFVDGHAVRVPQRGHLFGQWSPFPLGLFDFASFPFFNAGLFMDWEGGFAKLLPTNVAREKSWPTPELLGLPVHADHVVPEDR